MRSLVSIFPSSGLHARGRPDFGGPIEMGAPPSGLSLRVEDSRVAGLTRRLVIALLGIWTASNTRHAAVNKNC